MTVPQTGYVFTVEQPFGYLMYPSSDCDLIDSHQPGHLTEAVAVLKVHCHQRLVLSLEQIHSAGKKVDSVANNLL